PAIRHRELQDGAQRGQGAGRGRGSEPAGDQAADPSRHLSRGDRGDRPVAETRPHVVTPVGPVTLTGPARAGLCLLGEARPARAGPTASLRLISPALPAAHPVAGRRVSPGAPVVQLAATASRALPAVASQAIGFAGSRPGARSPGDRRLSGGDGRKVRVSSVGSGGLLGSAGLDEGEANDRIHLRTPTSAATLTTCWPWPWVSPRDRG